MYGGLLNVEKCKAARETGILRVKGNTEAKVSYPFSGPFPRGDYIRALCY